MASLFKLNDHPFAVEAFFTSSAVLTYAIPESDIRHLIPPCLKLDTFRNEWAFVAVAIVNTTDLRPKGFPRFLGNDFILIGYRIFVRYTTSSGKRLRGLYILGSQTNKKKMEFLGSVFTRYNYTTTDITQNFSGNELSISSRGSDISISLTIPHDDNIHLPASSPFSDWKEARRFAGPLPFTFSFDEEKKRVLIIEGVREHWIPQPLLVDHAHVGFLRQAAFRNAILANAFLLKDIPYYWKKGIIDPWRPTE